MIFSAELVTVLRFSNPDISRKFVHWLSIATEFNDLEHQNKGFYAFLVISDCETHFKSELRRNH